MGLTFVQGFRTFTQTSRKTIMNEGILQNLLIPEYALFRAGNEGIKQTFRASSTVSLPLGASVVTSTSGSSISSGVSSPASDILCKSQSAEFVLNGRMTLNFLRNMGCYVFVRYR